MAWSLHVRPVSEQQPDLSTLAPPQGDLLPFRVPPVADSARACCCPASAHVQVLLSGAGSHAAPLLFCGHHWRSHRNRLIDLGAALYDRTGQRVETGVGAEPRRV